MGNWYMLIEIWGAAQLILPFLLMLWLELYVVHDPSESPADL